MHEFQILYPRGIGSSMSFQSQSRRQINSSYSYFQPETDFRRTSLTQFSNQTTLQNLRQNNPFEKQIPSFCSQRYVSTKYQIEPKSSKIGSNPFLRKYLTKYQIQDEILTQSGRQSTYHKPSNNQHQYIYETNEYMINKIKSSELKPKIITTESHQIPSIQNNTPTKTQIFNTNLQTPFSPNIRESRTFSQKQLSSPNAKIGQNFQKQPSVTFNKKLITNRSDSLQSINKVIQSKKNQLESILKSMPSVINKKVSTSSVTLVQQNSLEQFVMKNDLENILQLKRSNSIQDPPQSIIFKNKTYYLIPLKSQKQ